MSALARPKLREVIIIPGIYNVNFFLFFLKWARGRAIKGGEGEG